MLFSLNEHLRRGESHDGLPFHPDCPYCQVRLSGALRDGSLISPRIAAAVSAGVLALPAAAAPALALAEPEPDVQREGTVAPEDPGGGDSAHRADLDPGGASSVLPDTPDPAPAPASPGSDDADDPGPVEREPATSASDVTVVDAGDDAAPSDTPRQPDATPASVPVPPAPAPATPVVVEPAPTPAPVPAPVLNEEASAQPPAIPQVKTERKRRGVREPARGVIAPARAGVVVLRERAAARLARVVQYSASRSSNTSHRGLTRHSRWYVVQPNDSLWEIAADLLGHDAGSTNPKIIEAINDEKNRLYRLNRKIIGDDPSLILPGQRLRLR